MKNAKTTKNIKKSNKQTNEEISFSRRAFFFLVVSSETAFLAPLCRVVGRVFVSTHKQSTELKIYLQ